MTYGKDKQRDMIRSILPSKYDWVQKEKRIVKKRQKSKVRAELNHYRNLRVEDAEATFEDSGFNYEKDSTRQIKYIVRDRRYGDKSAPLEKWAPHQVKDVRWEDRLSKIAHLFPNNTVGRHARDHIAHLNEFYDPLHDAKYSFWPKEESIPAVGKLTGLSYNERRKASISKRVELQKKETEILKKDLLFLIESGYLAMFNKNFVVYPDRVWTDGGYYVLEKRDDKLVSRPLLGTHDIDNFVRGHSKKAILNALAKIPKLSFDSLRPRKEEK